MRGDVSKSFGKYELMERIGKGGMAEVFLARSVGAEGVEKSLVIKKILPELATNDRFIEMFISEAKIAMGLNHPNIVQIYDFGKVGDDYFLAMEHVDGVELGRLLRAAKQVQEALAIGDAVYLAMEAARGLDYAHRRVDVLGRDLGIVHCDISPENLMISWDGALKIVDFGIAKVSTVGSDAPVELQGKYQYMSPEQALGHSVDKRSDIFSLGTVLFEMVCRRALFGGTTPEETLSLVKSAIVPDVLKLNPDVPELLEHALYKGLARRPEERFQTAREFQSELTRVLYGLPDIHDTTTVSEYLRRVEQSLPNDSVEMVIQGEELGRQHQETALTQPGHTPRIELTPTLNAEPAAVQLLNETARQRTEVVILTGEITGLKGSASDERRAYLRDEYRRIIDSIAYKNDAVVHRVDPSGFIILLGIPVSNEADAERAARMAFELEDAIAEMSVDAEFDLSTWLSVVVDEVVLEEVVATDQRHFQWILEDDVADRSRRLAMLVEAGEIAVDAQIYRRVRRSYSCEQIDDGPAKEATDQSPEPRYRLVGAKSARAQIRELRKSFHSFYGRDIQRRLLRDIFRQILLNEQQRALLFVGRTGVGKSTLVEEFLSGINTDDVRVVRGVASPFNRDVPLASAVALFSEMMGLNPSGGDQKIRQQLQGHIDTFFGDVSEQERELVRESLFRLFGVLESSQELAQLSGAERRQRLFVTLSKITSRMGRDRPLVLAIDDVHHIDPVMLAFTAEYFNRPQGVPVFFVGTGRGTGPHVQSRAWKDLMQAQQVKVERLGELAAPEAEKLIGTLLAAHGDESEELVRILLDRSGGNPLYIKEMVDTLMEHKRSDVVIDLVELAASDDLLPSSVEGLVRARIDRLDVQSREAIKRLSLLPSPFSIDEARAVIDARPAPVLQGLVGEGIVQRSGDDGSDATYRFVNAVTREMANRSLVSEEAESFHRRIADHLLRRRERYDSALIARHLEAAGDIEGAIRLYEEAVEDAFQEFGADQCLRLCDRILAYDSVSNERRFRVLKWRESALSEIGDASELRVTLKELERLAPRVASGDERIDVALRRARFFIDEGELTRARQAVEDAHELAVEFNDQLGKADAWRVEAIINLGEGRRDRALALIDRAIASLNLGADPRARRTMVEAYSVRGVILRQSGRHREALEAYETALAAATGLESTTLMRQLLINSGLALAYVGEFSEARRRYQRALDACRRLGHRRDEALVWINLGHVDQMIGRLDRAEKYVVRGIYLARQTESHTTVCDGKITLGLVSMDQGSLTQARSLLEQGLETAQAIPNAYLIVCAGLGLAQVELADDENEAAVQRAQKLLKRCQEAGLMWGVAMSHEVLAQGYSRIDEFETALHHSEEAVALLDEIDLLGIDQVLVTHAELLHQVPGREQESRDTILRALQVFEKRRDAIDSSDDRTAFIERPSNGRIRALASQLSEQ